MLRLCNFCHEVSSIEITNEQYEQVESGMPLIQVIKLLHIIFVKNRDV